jgi:hypothetical protein
MASSDQPRATPIDAPENRAGSLPWLILLGVVALLLIYAFQFYSSPDAPSSGEPSAAPANPQQEAAEKEAAKPLELDIQSADEAP